LKFRHLFLVRSANRGGFPRVDQGTTSVIFNLVSQARSNCRGCAERLVDAAEIVEHEIQRQRVAMVSNFLLNALVRRKRCSEVTFLDDVLICESDGSDNR
jgi:hypothetical protein